MISTISMQSQCTLKQDLRHHTVSLTANAAGDPLPLIPRRHHPQPWPLPLSPRSSPSLSTSSSLSLLCDGNEPSIRASASIVTITPATPPKAESDSDSSPRRGKRRKRDVRVINPTALYPPELSTPIPTLSTPWSPSFNSSLTPISVNDDPPDASRPTPFAPARAPLLYTPGMPLRFSIESLRNINGLSLRPSLSASDSLSPSSSLSSVSSVSMGSSQATPTSTPVIRKKSGQVVRPSLKSSTSCSTSRSASNFGLGIMSPNLSFPSSKSEPVTPLSVTAPSPSKAVHFDKNLAQVKLFLTQQKPLAVSRDGSPVDTDEGETSASGAESHELTKFFGSISLLGNSEKKPPTKLLMHTDIPLRSLPLSSPTPDVALESLLLATGDKSILGSVLVRNIAYDKLVTARFSFDGWCTTSEVNAKWKEGAGAARGGGTQWDRFEFVIWLGDLKLGEEKGNSRKLELAVRYRVGSKGYELWDNNGGRNYVATFDRPGLIEEKERGRKARLKKKVPPLTVSDDELSDLLEKAATSKTTRKSRSISPTVPRPWMSTPSHRSPSTPPFSTMPCKPPGLHARTRSFPFSASSSSQSTQSANGWMETSPLLPQSPLVPAWLTRKGMYDNQVEKATSPIRTIPTAPPATLGSPRDLGDDIFHSHIKFPTIPGNDSEESVDDSRQEGRKIRRHQRGGYFDFSSKQLDAQESTVSVKHDCTPAEPATPTPPPSSRFHSFPPLGLTYRDSAGRTLGQVETRVKDLPMDASLASQANGISSPSASSASQSETVAPSKLLSIVVAKLAMRNADDTSDSSSSTSTTLLENESPSSSRSSTPPTSDDRELYMDFLNRFCFFTGPGSPRSLSNTRFDDDVMNKMMNDSGSSESPTPTITPSGSTIDPPATSTSES